MRIGNLYRIYKLLYFPINNKKNIWAVVMSSDKTQSNHDPFSDSEQLVSEAKSDSGLLKNQDIAIDDFITSDDELDALLESLSADNEANNIKIDEQEVEHLDEVSISSNLQPKKTLLRKPAPLEVKGVERKSLFGMLRSSFNSKNNKKIDNEKIINDKLTKVKIEQDELAEMEQLKQKGLEKEKKENFDRTEIEKVKHKQNLLKAKKDQEKRHKKQVEHEISKQLKLKQAGLKKEKVRNANEAKDNQEGSRLEREKLKPKLVKARLEQFEKEKAEQERLEQVRLEEERLVKEKAEQERLEKERLAKEKAEQERLKQEQLEKERLAKEKAELERFEEERLAKKKAEQERLKQEQLEKERLEKERLAKEKTEQERLKLEQEKIERERVELGKAVIKLEREKVELEKAKLDFEKAKLEQGILTRETLENESDELDQIHDVLTPSSNPPIFGSTLAGEIRSSIKPDTYISIEESVILTDKKEKIATDFNDKTQITAERCMLLCGDNKNIDISSDIEKIYFDLGDFALSLFLEKLEQIKKYHQVIQLTIGDVIIIMDHTLNTVYCNVLLTKEEFVEKCCQPIDRDNISIYELDYNEIKAHKIKIREQADFVHSIESFIWTVSLLTSRGRLPENTDVTKLMSLKTGLDLSGLEPIPYVSEIVKLLNHEPSSLLEISEKLQVPQKFVFAFYNAVLSLNMIEYNIGTASKAKKTFGRLFRR